MIEQKKVATSIHGPSWTPLVKYAEHSRVVALRIVAVQAPSTFVAATPGAAFCARGCQPPVPEEADRVAIAVACVHVVAVVDAVVALIVAFALGTVARAHGGVATHVAPQGRSFDDAQSFAAEA